MDIKQLNKNQLWQLRKEIVLGSIFLKDYSNSFDIDEKNACNFFDGYLENLFWMADKNIDIFDLCEKYDNAYNLYNYFCEVYAV